MLSLPLEIGRQNEFWHESESEVILKIVHEHTSDFYCKPLGHLSTKAGNLNHQSNGWKVRAPGESSYYARVI